MKVTMLRSPAKSLGCDLTEGETGIVSKALGEKLIGLRIAEDEDDKKTAVKGVSKTAEVKGVTKSTDKD